MVDNFTENAALEVAAFAVERAIGGASGTVAGLLVQPVAWAVTGDGPDAADSFIYGAGAAGAVAGSLIAIPALLTGALKALVDDSTTRLVEAARLDEPESLRGGIQSVGEFSFFASGGHIQAMEVASRGGVAWQHPNGVYLFLRDANGLPVCDYLPRRFRRIYRPHIPLQLNGSRVRYTTTRP